MTAGRSSGAAAMALCSFRASAAAAIPVSSIYNVLVAGMYEFSGALHSESSKIAVAAVLQGTSRSEKPDCENVKKEHILFTKKY